MKEALNQAVLVLAIAVSCGLIQNRLTQTPLPVFREYTEPSGDGVATVSRHVAEYWLRHHQAVLVVPGQGSPRIQQASRILLYCPAGQCRIEQFIKQNASTAQPVPVYLVSEPLPDNISNPENATKRSK